jgi:hypothetical protein
MRTLVPPEPPARVSLGDDGGSSRLRLRLHQITVSALTILITVWCFTLGAIPAVISVTIAKHILVAVLVMGLGVDAPEAVGRPAEADD